MLEPKLEVKTEDGYRRMYGITKAIKASPVETATRAATPTLTPMICI